MSAPGRLPGRCAGKVWDGWRHYPCQKKATRDSWCGIHHPDRKAARLAKSEARYAEQQAKWDAERKLRAENERRLAEYDTLREAIEEALEFIEGYVDVVDGDYGQPAPNRAMQLQSTLLTALGRRLAP